MTDDPAHHLNLLKCQADFTYRMTVRAIRILDTGSVAGFRIMYRDPDGYWDGVKWDGKRAAGKSTLLNIPGKLDLPTER